MIKSLLGGLLALVLLAAPGRADYVLVQKVEGSTQSGSMTIKLKDGKARADMAPQVSTITDGASGDVITLMHAQKSYMRIPAAQSKALLEQMQKQQKGAQGGGAALAKLTPTGRTEKVGEHEAEIFTWSAPGGMTVTYWIAKKFPNFTNIAAAMQTLQTGGLAGAAGGMMPNPSDFPGMAVKTELNVGGQKVTTTLVSVSEENVDAAAFEVPADYKEMPAPAFGFPAK